MVWWQNTRVRMHTLSYQPPRGGYDGNKDRHNFYMYMLMHVWYNRTEFTSATSNYQPIQYGILGKIAVGYKNV